MCRYLGLDVLKDDVGADHRDIDAELFEQGFVLGIDNAGYGTWHLEPVLCQLTGNQVILIIAGDGNEHAGTVGADVGQDSHL